MTETHIVVRKNELGGWHAVETTTDHTRWIGDRGTYTAENLIRVVRNWRDQGRTVRVFGTEAEIEELKAAQEALLCEVEGCRTMAVAGGRCSVHDARHPMAYRGGK